MQQYYGNQFKKIKSQIHPFKPGVKQGHIFIATDGLIKLIVYIILTDEDWNKEFSL